jgi:hypothetical protein
MPASLAHVVVGFEVPDLAQATLKVCFSSFTIQERSCEKRLQRHAAQLTAALQHTSIAVLTCC